MCSSSSMIKMRLFIAPLLFLHLLYDITVHSFKNQFAASGNVTVIPYKITQKDFSLRCPEPLFSRRVPGNLRGFPESLIRNLNDDFLLAIIWLSIQKPSLILLVRESSSDN